jgi:hypothetical protein
LTQYRKNSEYSIQIFCAVSWFRCIRYYLWGNYSFSLKFPCSLGSMHVCFNKSTWLNDASQQTHGFVQSIAGYQGDFARYDNTIPILHIPIVLEYISMTLQAILYYVWGKLQVIQIREYISGVGTVAANVAAQGGSVKPWTQIVQNAKSCLGLSGWIPLFWQKAIFWISFMRTLSNISDNKR